ncbi:outer membrane beta-barrel protein [Vicingaceae bacterium]|nr:outer membrane beta-barrel protein [Vicingaceae bacterium]
MRYILTTTLIFLFANLSAQFSISGYLLDEKNEGLPFASVVLLSKSDSAIVAFGLSNNQGKYLVDLQASGDYLLQYSFVGYKTIYNPLVTDWKENKIILKNTVLKVSNVELGEVQVTAERIPMKMKGDTIEYDATAFKVAEDSDVEKLLSRMPGIEVDKDGNITAYGKKVEKIMVDGKEFFGDDPKMATKNIEANAIDKVEVLDKKSKEAEFTGVDDGEETKTINLTLKEEFKKGSFGRVKAGVGTEETYKGKINYNRFNKKTQMSVIGNTNNINEEPFSWREFNEFAPGNDWNTDLIRGIGGNEGINSALSLGINANHEFSKKFEVQGFYYLTQNNGELDKAVNTENFARSQTFKTNQEINNNEDKLNHSFNLKADWQADSMTKINLWSNLFLNHERYDNRNRTVFTPSNETTDFTQNNNDNDVQKSSTYNSATYKRKFKKDRRNVNIYLNHYGLNQENTTKINNELFGTPINQLQEYDQTQSRWRGGVSYTEPLDSFWVATIGYSNEQERQEPKRDFFNLSQNGSEAIFDDSLSSSFERVAIENSGSLTFRRNKNKSNFSFGSTFNQTQLQVTNIDRNFQYVLPFASYRRRLKGSQSLSIRYSTRTNLPNLDQLVTIPDNTNTNRLFIGNPDLVPTYNHQVSFNYWTYDPAKQMNIYTGASLTVSNNRILNQVIVNENFTTVITPQNSGFYQGANFYGGINMPIKKLKIKVGFNPNANFDRSDVFLNTEETQVFSANYSTRVSLERLKKEKCNVRVGVTLSYNDRKYEANSNFNQTIRNYSWFGEGEYEIGKTMLFKVDYSYNRFASTRFVSEQDFHLISASFRKSFNDDNWAINLIANDILNENIGVQRSGDINTIYEANYNTRAQFFMLMLEKRIGKKVTNPNRKKGNRRYYSN